MRLESIEIDQGHTLQWNMLEDLAVRDQQNSEAYKHIVNEKGQKEVGKRRKFLEVEWLTKCEQLILSPP